MIVREKIWPKKSADLFSMLFILTIIPLVYYFEMFVVLQSCYNPSSKWFYFHFICGTFIMINAVSNFVAALFVDTNVRPTSNCTNNEICSVCEISVPDRAWHCHSCDVCILKRDHHCTFIGYCIGHFNHRYFIWLVFFIFAGTVYGTYLNFFYVRENFSFNPLIMAKLIFPVTFLLFGYDKSVNYCHLILISINFVGMFISGILLWYHVKLILNGTTCFEAVRNETRFNLGLKGNIIRVLGVRWYMTWLSAFIKSELLEDGVHWTSNSRVKSN